MSEDTNEKVDWVVPIAQGLTLGKTPASNFAKAATLNGIRLDNVRTNGEGRTVVDINQEVIKGMPAPRKDVSKENKP
jgi:hypothetical protein